MSNNEMMWSILLHLGTNMWRKKDQENCSPTYKDYEDDFDDDVDEDTDDETEEIYGDDDED